LIDLISSQDSYLQQLFPDFLWCSYFCHLRTHYIVFIIIYTIARNNHINDHNTDGHRESAFLY